MDVPRLFTVGHSTRTLEELLEILSEAQVEVLVDVRRYPGSRRHPHFGQVALKDALQHAGLAYLHEVDLGGRRRGVADSPNGAWRNASFRAYADHLQSAAFQEALHGVLELARTRRVAVMCAELHPSRCHRRLIADQVRAMGWNVTHLLELGRASEHVLEENARQRADGVLEYPARTDAGGLFAD